MRKTILLTGATDGIGFETAKRLLDAGHRVLLHGRSEQKLTDTRSRLLARTAADDIETFCADLSSIPAVMALIDDISSKHENLDVIINNAGVYKTANPVTPDGHDLRFIVNTIAPYLLTKRLLPLLAADGRVVNLSSAAQAPVDLAALAGRKRLGDSAAYAQSKLAITMWSRHLAKQLADGQQVVVAVNPASLLASKMVKEAYGVAGSDLGIGADALVRAALSDEFADASGKYFDNDNGRFASPHPDAMNPGKNAELVETIEGVLEQLFEQR